MEILNLMMGEVEDAYFTIQQFTENQELEEAFVPPTDIEVILGKQKPFPKQEDEVRLIIADYAFANTIRGRGQKANDNTIIICMSLHWKDDHFERHVDFIQGWAGSDSTGAVNRIRELYWDYEADYIVDDQQSGGEVIYNLFTQPWEHPKRGHAWNSHGFTISDKKDYVSAVVAAEGKVEDYKSRTVDPHAIPCIIPVKAQSGLNSVMWAELRRQLDYGNIKFLIDAKDYKEMLMDTGEYFKMTSEEYGTACAPYNHTEELIKEAVNLKAEFKQDKVRLTEPLNGTKDRIVALSYGNYIATLIENKWNKDLAQETFEIDDMQLVW